MHVIILFNTNCCHGNLHMLVQLVYMNSERNPLADTRNCLQPTFGTTASPKSKIDQLGIYIISK